MVRKIRKVLTRYFAEMRWYNIMLVLAFYALSSWLLLYSANETALLQFDDFMYWLVVTGSTVGYGDMSPATAAGKWIVSLYIIPVGLSIFALVLGRVAAWVSEQWQKGVKGLKPLDLHDHIVVIGWNEQRTIQLINMLQQERAAMPQKPDILLCVRAEILNPLPGEIEFVKVASFNKDEDMNKACIKDASVIIMDNPEDDMTMTTALYCSQANPDAHLIAYFKDESLVQLLKHHCPNVECTPSVAVEMIAKSAFDPGSSLVQHDLLSLQYGEQSQFSATIPDSVSSLVAGDVFANLKSQYDATFIGFLPASGAHNPTLNPAPSDRIKGGDKIFYIAKQRLPDIKWSSLGAQ
ncbi:potassium channel family protein [Aestuariibacter sp. AA17]|uniref:Potassium channel family protein n=1 Tax=Fluctibacter corallii TaxID=2984329 RepID=A0ABT3ABL0_9ALTE|nr:potassium channel family protein [Aestuariibacter sp. AA17]MCV2886065.1 potassium channel family protein [Aestuariibacter sp. AA17]